MEVVIIPSYQPNERLLTLLAQLTGQGVGLLVVDDGSGPEYGPIFARAETWAKVIHQPRNTGKGAALRRGMAELEQLFPGCTHFITADGDGQHSPEDILRLTRAEGAEHALILTERDLGRDIPFFSKLGNDTSRVVFTLLTGRYFKDNQSGLRRFAVEQIPWLLEAKGDRYEYEMNMLYYAHKLGVPIRTTPIRTIYFDNNAATHFHPRKDTLRIYRRLFTTARGSVIGAVLAQVGLALVSSGPGWDRCWLSVPLVGLASGVASLLVNALWVFPGRRLDWVTDYLRLAARYLLLGIGATGLGLLWQRPGLFWTVQLLQLVLLPLRYVFWKLARRLTDRRTDEEHKD